MSKPAAPDEQGTSTRPYLIRALHDWCTDNGFTPYIAVHVGPGVQVPMEYVKNNEIVLNIGFEATSGMKLGNDFIEFRARFGGVARDIVVPMDHVVAIYARENGQGMAFPVPAAAGAGPQPPQDSAGRSGLRLAGPQASADDEPATTITSVDEVTRPDPEPLPPGPPATPGRRPSLKRVK
jgi:stringent starvation protein B